MLIIGLPCAICQRSVLLRGSLDILRYQDQLEVVKINIDEEVQLSEDEKIEIIPTLVLYQGGNVLGSITAPGSKAEINEFIQTTMKKTDTKEKKEAQIYDMAVIGGGPGGYTAAMYAARAGLNTVLLEKLSAGGQMALTHQIDNYPGYEDGIDGISLAEKNAAGSRAVWCADRDRGSVIR